LILGVSLKPGCGSARAKTGRTDFFSSLVHFIDRSFLFFSGIEETFLTLWGSWTLCYKNVPPFNTLPGNLKL
jgi:hypothetical protein